MKRVLALIVVLVFLVPTLSWAQILQFTITVTDGSSSKDLTIGFDPTSTDNFDAVSDQVAPPAPPAGTFDARIKGNDTDYFKDIRGVPAEGVTMEFELNWRAATGQGPIVITWNNTGLATIGDFTLIDPGVPGVIPPGGFANQDMTTSTTFNTSNPNCGFTPLCAGGMILRVTPDPTFLPVELVSFDAVTDGNDALLQWATASETNNAGFQVEHRHYNSDFASLGFVDGYGTTELAKSYEHRVEGLAPGPHVFRLKQIDYDGTFAYSPEVEVTIDLPTAYVLSDAYPNPFNPEAQFTLQLRADQQVRVEVVNLLGQRVAQLHEGTLQADALHTFQVDGSELPSGLYLLRVVGENFAETKSLTLLK